MKYIVSVNQVIGALAMWSVRQHPYAGKLKGLTPALVKLGNVFEAHCETKIREFVCTEMSNVELYNFLETAFEFIPEIRDWNNSDFVRDGGHQEYAFSSRYGNPDPYYDFIDLGALANNVTRTIMEESSEYYDSDNTCRVSTWYDRLRYWFSDLKYHILPARFSECQVSDGAPFLPIIRTRVEVF